MGLKKPELSFEKKGGKLPESLYAKPALEQPPLNKDISNFIQQATDVITGKTPEIPIPDHTPVNPYGKIPFNPSKQSPPPKQSPQEVFDKVDEKQIELMTEGFVVSQPFSETKDEETGELFFMITYAGVMQLVQKRGSYEVIGQPIPEHTNTHYVYTIQCKDTKKSISTFGMGMQERYDRNKKEIKFAQIKALSKAQRNSFRSLLEASEIEEFFAAWYKDTYHKEPDTKLILLVSGSANINQFKK